MSLHGTSLESEAGGPNISGVGSVFNQHRRGTNVPADERDYARKLPCNAFRLACPFVRSPLE